jgi:hypothetical protein
LSQKRSLSGSPEKASKGFRYIVAPSAVIVMELLPINSRRVIFFIVMLLADISLTKSSLSEIIP